MCVIQFSKLQIDLQQTCRILLVFFRFLGLLFGVVVSAGADHSFLLLMRSSFSSVSIVGLLLVAVLPFLFAASAVFLSNRFLVFLIAFLKAFSFGYCVSGLAAVYGNGFWLGCFLLMFSDFASLPVVMWFWIQCIGSSRKHLGSQLFLSLMISSVFAFADYWIISPFAASIL